MRKLPGLFTFILITGVILALVSCSGTGGRRLVTYPGFFTDIYYPVVEAIQLGDALTLLDNPASPTGKDAFWAGANDIANFDSLSFGGLAFVRNESYFRIFDFLTGEYYGGLQSLDANGDGYPDSVEITMRALPNSAVNTPYSPNFALVGGADYFPHELYVGNVILYLPINQAFANATLYLARWEPGSSWVPAGVIGDVIDHPLAAFAGKKVYEIRGYTGFLGAFGIFAQIHSQGTGQ